MLKILAERLRQHHRTVGYPNGAPSLPERFRGLPVLDPGKCAEDCHACVEACPTGALSDEGKGLTLDMGRCLFCAECSTACPEGAVTFSSNHRLAARSRADLVLGPQGPKLAAALDEKLRRLFSRSLKLRQVSAGGCNGCESDVNVLGTVVFDLGRFGIQMVASPRHADGILVTGAIGENMKLALKKTYDAVPAPKIVIAVGACAISGGPYIGHPEVSTGLDSIVPVDLYIPGCPPHPFTILDGLLRLLGRIDDGKDERFRNAAEKYREQIRAETVEWGTKRAEEAIRYFGANPTEDSTKSAQTDEEQ